MREKWQEKIRKLNNEELVKEIKRGGIVSVIAGRELLSRRESLTRNSLRCILEGVRTYGSREKEVVEIREKAAIKAKEKRFIDEGLFLVILDNIDSQGILKGIGDEYLSRNKDVSNQVLKGVIRRIPRLKWEAGGILSKQAKDGDDLLLIEEELDGSPLQIEAWKTHWEKFGMKPEDFTYLTWAVPSLTEKNWERGKKEGMIEKLSIWQLYEIWHYTDSRKVKKEVKEKLLPRIKKELEKKPRIPFIKKLELEEIKDELEKSERTKVSGAFKA